MTLIIKEMSFVSFSYNEVIFSTHFIDKIIELEEEKERKELGKEQTD